MKILKSVQPCHEIYFKASQIGTVLNMVSINTIDE